MNIYERFKKIKDVTGQIGFLEQNYKKLAHRNFNLAELYKFKPELQEILG